jgi:hypothetical protein
MRILIGKFITIACLLGMAGYADAAQSYTWQDIKQAVAPTTPTPSTEAYLKVYTKSEEVNDGGYLWVRGPRYTIFSGEGKLVKSVTNESGTPNTFTLSPGKYVIVPDDGQSKKEIVGAVLEPGKLTEVHMMGG